MKSHILRAAFCSAILAGAAHAQAFNLDIEGGGGGVPAPTFSAFSGQAGFWDALGVNVSTPTLMNDITGGQPGATYTYDAAIPMMVQTLTAGAYGSAPPLDVRRLYDDYHPGIPNNQIRFQNLQPGRYRFFVYAWLPNGLNNVYFQVGQSNAGLPRTMVHGFPFPSPPDFVLGQTVVARTLTVEAGEDVIITALCQGALLPGGSVVNNGGPGTGVGEGGGDGGNGDDGGIPPNSCSFAGFQIVPVNGTQGCPQSRANSLGGIPRINALGTINPQGDFDASQNITLSAGSLPGVLPPNRQILTFVSNNFGTGNGQIQPLLWRPPRYGHHAVPDSGSDLPRRHGDDHHERVRRVHHDDHTGDAHHVGGPGPRHFVGCDAELPDDLSGCAGPRRRLPGRPHPSLDAVGFDHLAVAAVPRLV